VGVQEFEVVPSRTVREEFLSAFAEQMWVKERLEEVQVALEKATDDMDAMAALLDELDELQKKAESVDLYDVDVKINKMLPELGFELDDCDRLVASYSGGWQMRMSLGKILLQARPLRPWSPSAPPGHLGWETGTLLTLPSCPLTFRVFGAKAALSCYWKLKAQGRAWQGRSGLDGAWLGSMASVCRSRTCCCWMSRRTTWTWTPSSGWRST